MSYQVGMDTILLKPTERIAHTEYCSNADLVQAITTGSRKSFNDRWQFDFIWTVNDGPVPWSNRGRVTDMGHAEFLKDGVDRREPVPSPFTDPEQALEFDAVKEYGLPDFDELVEYYQVVYDKGRKANPDQVVPGGYYKTIVSGAIQSFGWDMLLAAASDQERCEKTLDSFFRLSLHHYKAWAKTSIEVFICLDDMVWSEGPFLHPAFYRKVIFPRYRELWSVLRKAGKKVLYCSDGKIEMFFKDLADAGADGFIFEPMNPLDPVVEEFGRTHVIMGSKVDCRTLTFGDKEQIKKEIDATLELAFRCPGFVFAVGNHIPSNVPVENGLFYFNYLSRNWRR